MKQRKAIVSAGAAVVATPASPGAPVDEGLALTRSVDLSSVPQVGMADATLGAPASSTRLGGSLGLDHRRWSAAATFCSST